MHFASVVVATLAVTTVLCAPPVAADISYTIVVDAGGHDHVNCPAKTNLIEALAQANDRPARLKDANSVKLVDSEGNEWPAQLTKPGLLNPLASQDGQLVRELHFVVPNLKKGEKLELTAVLAKQTDSQGYRWEDTPGEYTDLLNGDRPVLRYMYKAVDNATPHAREETYKVFHHVYSFDGKYFVTKGAGGKYSHHRGLFYGFNRVSYEGVERVDLWGCGAPACQVHAGFVGYEAGPVLGRHCVAVDWRGKNSKAFAKEFREMTVYDVPDGRLIEFASRLQSVVGRVKLDGDPQHAGFHFRAAQEVADGDQKLTYYLRPDGRGGPGETRNWPGNKDFVNLPWNAMSFVIDGQRYTAAYLDRPSNPKEARYSERSYGRFGSYFEYELDEDKPLELNYRVWLQEGEMAVEDAVALRAEFISPPRVIVR